MNSLSPATKHKYDITMSRRTRKQTPCEKLRSEGTNTDTKNRENGGIVVSLENLMQVKDGEEIGDHKSLKQLIRGDGETNSSSSSNNKGGRNSLVQHFNEEEKNLQVVVKKNQNESAQEGLKFKKLVKRYAKVLGHMMKAKRDPHLGESAKKSVFKLPK